MRITAHPRHARRQAPSRWTYVIALLGALAALITSLAFSGQSGQAAQAQAVAPRVTMLDRAAEIAVTADGALLAQDKAAIARTVLAAGRARAAAAAATYTVRAGDSLSGVAVRRCGQGRLWTGIYAASRARHWTAGNANRLTAGQHLFIACQYLPSMLKYAPAPPPPPRPVYRFVRAVSGFSGHRSYRTYHRAYRSSSSAYSGTYRGSGGFQSCVISRESGGNARAVNASSGAGGLYQFLPSTWHALGHSGLPENASVAEQNAAFQQAYAQSGTSPWHAYDGC